MTIPKLGLRSECHFISMSSPPPLRSRRLDKVPPPPPKKHSVHCLIMSSGSLVAQGNYCSQRWAIAFQFGFYWVNRSLLRSISLSHSHTYTHRAGGKVNSHWTHRRGFGEIAQEMELDFGAHEGACVRHVRPCVLNISVGPGRYTARTHISVPLSPFSEGPCSSSSTQSARIYI